MRTQNIFASLGSFLVLASLVSPLPAIARASGAESTAEKTANVAKAEKNNAPAAKPREDQPKEDQPKKVYTNDDFGWYSPSASAASAFESKQTAAPALSESAASSVAEPKPLDPQQDPQWYAQQVISLENDLAIVQSKEDALQQFRATSAGLPTGLDLAAPTEGITTDNLIAQLESQREQIAQQIDDLADLARVNGLPPGTINHPSAPEPPPPTLAEQQDALTVEYGEASDQLAENQATLDAMQQQAAAQGITLLPSVPGEGGNLTTNLLDDLDSQATALQSALSDAEDNARTLGLQPGALR
jgi:hypothetical protein